MEHIHQTMIYQDYQRYHIGSCCISSYKWSLQPALGQGGTHIMISATTNQGIKIKGNHSVVLAVKWNVHQLELKPYQVKMLSKNILWGLRQRIRSYHMSLFANRIRTRDVLPHPGDDRSRVRFHIRMRFQFYLWLPNITPSNLKGVNSLDVGYPVYCAFYIGAR